jgi:hypothetical protein
MAMMALKKLPLSGQEQGSVIERPSLNLELKCRKSRDSAVRLLTMIGGMFPNIDKRDPSPITSEISRMYHLDSHSIVCEGKNGTIRQMCNNLHFSVPNRSGALPCITKPKAAPFKRDLSEDHFVEHDTYRPHALLGDVVERATEQGRLAVDSLVRSENMNLESPAFVNRILPGLKGTIRLTLLRISSNVYWTVSWGRLLHSRRMASERLRERRRCWRRLVGFRLAEIEEQISD